jgi:hypothetical protein
MMMVSDIFGGARFPNGLGMINRDNDLCDRMVPLMTITKAFVTYFKSPMVSL